MAAQSARQSKQPHPEAARLLDAAGHRLDRGRWALACGPSWAGNRTKSAVFAAPLTNYSRAVAPILIPCACVMAFASAENYLQEEVRDVLAAGPAIVTGDVMAKQRKPMSGELKTPPGAAVIDDGAGVVIAPYREWETDEERLPTYVAFEFWRDFVPTLIPVRWTPGEAWGLIDGVWQPLDSTEVGVEGRMLVKTAFEGLFGRDLPDLPEQAFKGRKNTAAS